MSQTVAWLTPVFAAPDGLSVVQKKFGPQLRSAGYRIHYLVPEVYEQTEVLDGYVSNGIIDSYSFLPFYRVSGWRASMARWVFFARWKDWLRRGTQQKYVEALDRELARVGAQALIVGDRGYLFAMGRLRWRGRLLIFWCDSFVLAAWRQMRVEYARRNWMGWLREAFTALAQWGVESYYPRFATVNLVVSPVDQKVIERISWQRVKRLSLGVDVITAPRMEDKIKNRLVFSGVMSFEPNYQSALWFLDEVWPLILDKKQGVEVVFAGRDPVVQLLARAGSNVHVTGRVDDMAAEIARGHLYVAPMVSGSGFKNKVVEALAAGTLVTGTPLAAEFCGEDLRAWIPVRETAAGLAEEIVKLLDLPLDEIEQTVLSAQECLRRQYTWAAVGRTLVEAVGGK